MSTSSPTSGPRRPKPKVLTERRVRFEYPEDLDVCWNPRFPEFACAANSISMLMPYAEPYFVRSVRAVIPQLEGAAREQAEGWARQEVQHHGQHRRFNNLLLERYPRLARPERWIARTYGWLGRTRSSRFNVAFAAGSETIAYGIARWSEERLGELFDNGDAVASTMYLWHLAEEIEHKSAAFDVFEATDGSRFRYATAMTLSFLILMWFTTMTTLVMLAGDHRLLRPVTWFRLLRWSISLAFELLPTMAVSALPGHHPSAFVDPPFLPRWLRLYDPETRTMPLWDTGLGDPGLPGGRTSGLPGPSAA